jgi:radical SAM superfamily enzyme YgiQ (UPF0313 family)
MMPQLALHVIQGLTPTEHETRIIDEEAEKVNLDEECDLVGISCMTANAPRAYELAEAFRKRGKAVVLGGVHPSILPEESLQHADCVVVGEAEGVWAKLLEDFTNGGLQKRYHDPNPDLKTYVPKNFSSLHSRRLFNVLPLMATRGCPYHCEFCCVTDLFGKKIRYVPVENIVRDIRESGAKNFIFYDDNIIGHPRYAKELFRAIKPLRIKWVGQASISFVKDEELMRLAAESGCKVLFIGFESVYERQLRNMKKAIKEIKDLESAIKKIKKMGILVHASMIFGFDNDVKETFYDSLKFLVKNKVSTVSFNVLTPYPGTDIYERFKSEGRLITTDWKYYDHNTVVFRPKNMTPQELQEGKLRARKQFYKYSTVLRRLLGNLYSPFIFLSTNFGHIKQTKREQKRMSKLHTDLFSNYSNTAASPAEEIQKNSASPASASSPVRKRESSPSSVSFKS